MEVREINRRQLLVRAAAAATSLSLAVSMGVAGRQASAMVDPPPDAKADNVLLNALLTAEYDAIATYTAGAAIILADTLTPKATRDVVTAIAQHFQSQHMDHAAALKKLIKDNGGSPAVDSGQATLPSSFPATTAQTTEVMKLAADKEKHAAVAYASVMQQLSTGAAAKLAASIGGVETQHFVVLYLLVEGLIATNDSTAMNPTLVVPASFVLNGAAGTQSLETSAALDELLTLDPA